MKKLLVLLVMAILYINSTVITAEDNYINYDFEYSYDYAVICRKPNSYTEGKFGNFENVVYDDDVEAHIYRERGKGDIIDDLIDKLSAIQLRPLNEEELNMDYGPISNDDLITIEFGMNEDSDLERVTWVLTKNSACVLVRVDGKSEVNYYEMNDDTELIEYIYRLVMIEADEQRALVKYEDRISKMSPFLIDGTPYVSIQQIGDFLGDVISTGKNNCDLYEIYKGLGYGELWSESQWWTLLYMDNTKGMYNLYEILDKYGYSAEWNEYEWCICVEKEIIVELNGLTVDLEQRPYIKNDRTLVPMRAIFEALGSTVTWDDTTKTAIGVKDGVEVKITIGENVLYKNGETIELDVVAEITNDRTMVPVRAIGEAFGCTVTWNDETKTVEITY